MIKPATPEQVEEIRVRLASYRHEAMLRLNVEGVSSLIALIDEQRAKIHEYASANKIWDHNYICSKRNVCDICGVGPNAHGYKGEVKHV